LAQLLQPPFEAVFQSNSWGSSASSVSLVNAIKAANDSDMLFVAAAGNNGSNNDVAPVYPASYGTPNIVSVAASTNWDELASFSNYGATSVDLAAPGEAILSTVTGNAYAVANGTSMATPYVSGTAMLALSTGAPIVVVASYETLDGWRGQMRPLAMPEPTGDRRTDARAITQAIADAFALIIAASPSDWHMFQPGWPADDA